jgi:hypothetical protein
MILIAQQLVALMINLKHRVTLREYVIRRQRFCDSGKEQRLTGQKKRLKK